MADGLAVTPGTGAKAATDLVTYSGELMHVGLAKLVTVQGAEDSKTVTDVPFNTNGRAAEADSTPVALSTEDLAALTTLASLLTAIGTNTDTLETLITAMSGKLPASLGQKLPSTSLSVVSSGLEYEAVAASATDAPLGATGAAGDYLSHVVVQPTSTTVGVVTVKDGATTVHAYPGGTVGADLKPFTLAIGARATTGWTITTGAGVTATGYGDFT